MTEREALLLLHGGYVERGADGAWTLLDTDDRGIFATWRPATEAERDGLDVAIALYPRVAELHDNLMARQQGHRGFCELLQPRACTCRQPETR